MIVSGQIEGSMQRQQTNAIFAQKKSDIAHIWDV